MAQLFAVLVGCNYKDSGTPPGRPPLPELHGAENDARRLALTLQQVTPPPADQLGHVALLLGEAATRENIRTALQAAASMQLRAAQAAGQTAEDTDQTVLFYFSGHADQASNGVILYTWDGVYPAADLLRDLGTDPAPTRLILDCCHAGAIDQVTAVQYAPLAAPAAGAPQDMCRVQILCGARADQSAFEAQGQGFFTHLLITALSDPLKGPALLKLPIDLPAWLATLPPDLHESDAFLGEQDVLGSAAAASKDATFVGTRGGMQGVHTRAPAAAESSAVEQSAFLPDTNSFYGAPPPKPTKA